MKIKAEALLCPRFSAVGMIAIGVAAFGAGYLASAKRSKPVAPIETPDEDQNQLAIPFEWPSVVHEKTDSSPKDISTMVEETVNLVRHSIFSDTDAEDEWDMEKEEASRKGKGIYVIHQDEFFGEESGYSQTSLNYYESDDILCDEEDVPIYNYENIVGELQFGHGTDDKNVTYIRNEPRECEYEVLRNQGSYANEVLGIEYDEELDRDIEKEGSKLYRRE